MKALLSYDATTCNKQNLERAVQSDTSGAVRQELCHYHHPMMSPHATNI